MNIFTRMYTFITNFRVRRALGVFYKVNKQIQKVLETIDGEVGFIDSQVDDIQDRKEKTVQICDRQIEENVKERNRLSHTKYKLKNLQSKVEEFTIDE